MTAFRLFFLLSALLLCSDRLFAQYTLTQRIEDSVVGWEKTLIHADKPTKVLTFGGQPFSVRQQEIDNLIVGWMQQSYTPVAGIGTFRKDYFSSKKYNVVHGYGVQFGVWDVEFEVLDANKHFKPVDETGSFWFIRANSIAGGSETVWFLSTPADYYFTMPRNGSYEDGTEKEKMTTADPQIHPHVHQYLTWVSHMQETVYLVPGNKLPIIPVGIGEYLDASDKAAVRDLADRTAEIKYKYSNDPRNLTSSQAVEEERTKRIREVIRKLKLKHAAELNKAAIVVEDRPTLQDFSGDNDPFELRQDQKESLGGKMIYRFDPAVYAKCQTDQPQWISITFPYYQKGNGRKKYELYRCMTEHFNYDYVYNYFFNPEKVKGQAYKPVNEAVLRSTIAGYAARGDWKQKPSVAAKSSGTFFSDDFSANATGARPAGWWSVSTRKPCLVTTIDGQPGQWVKMGGDADLSPTSLPFPMPENFSLEYDIVTDNFGEERTGGAMSVLLSGGKSAADTKSGANLEMRFTSGNETNLKANSNYRGESRINWSVYPSKMSYNEMGGESIKPLNEFTNANGKRKIHVKLVKKGSSATIYFNDKEFVSSAAFQTKYGKPCGECAIEPGVRFNKLVFRSITDDAEHIGVYLGNVKVTGL